MSLTTNERDELLAQCRECGQQAAAPTTWTWLSLVLANRSLGCWLRSAAQAGSTGWARWLAWVPSAAPLQGDVAAAVGRDAPRAEYRQALRVAVGEIRAAYTAAADRAAIAASRDARRAATAARKSRL
jgi:hypothetical protein